MYYRWSFKQLAYQLTRIIKNLNKKKLGTYWRNEIINPFQDYSILCKKEDEVCFIKYLIITLKTIVRSLHNNCF